MAAETKELESLDPLDDLLDGLDADIAPRGAEEEKDEKEEEPNLSLQSPHEALTIGEALGALVGRDLFSDVDFIVGDGSEKRTIPAHRLILAAASDIFEAMLYPPNLPSDGKEVKEEVLPVTSSGTRLTIEISDVKPHIFLTMLRAIYSDRCDIRPEDVSDLIRCANKYQIEKLRQLCLKFLEEGITAENACRLFENAPEDLVEQRAVMSYIEEFADEVFKSPGFDSLSLPRLKLLLENDNLCIEEVDLFRALLRWAVCECRRQRIADTVENRREVLAELLPLVRFPTMTMEEVATYVSPTQLLTSTELLEIFTYISAVNSARPAPSISFPTKPRPGGVEPWTLDRELRLNVEFTEDDTVARTMSTAWFHGSLAWKRGPHAWRVYRQSGGSAFLFLGVCRRMHHEHSPPWGGDEVWGFCSTNMQWSSGITHPARVSFNVGPIDVFFDASFGVLKVSNLSTRQTQEMKVPKGEELVPFFAATGYQTLKVCPIPRRQFGNRDYEPRRMRKPKQNGKR